MTIIMVMITTRSVAEAKARFTECIATAEAGNAVMITRHGKPVAALIRAEDLAKLHRLSDADPQAGLAGIMGSWDDEVFLQTMDEIVASRGKSRRVRSLS